MQTFYSFSFRVFFCFSFSVLLCSLTYAQTSKPSVTLESLQKALNTKNCDVLSAALNPPTIASLKKYEKYILLHTGLHCPDLPAPLANDVQARLAALQWTANEEVVFRAELALLRWQTALKTEDQVVALLALEDRIAAEKNSTTKETLIKDALKMAKDLKSEDSILRIERALYLNSPRLDPEVRKTNPFLAARNHRTWREFDDAIEIYEAVFKDDAASAEQKLDALKEKRQTIRSQQQRKKVLTIDEEILKFIDQEIKNQPANSPWFQKAVDAYLLAARALWTEGQFTPAQSMILEQIKNFEGKANIDEFHFLLGRMSEEKKDFDTALKHYDLIHKADGPSSIFKRTLWTKGWILFKTQKYKDAENAFSEFAKVTEEPNERFRGLFWQAEMLKRQKKISASRVIYAQVSDEDPFGYYGVMANRELKRRFRPFKASKTQHQLPKNFKAIHPEKAELIQKLMDLHLKPNLEIALAQFKPDLDSKISKMKSKPAIQNLEMTFMLAYARAGLYLPLFISVAALEPEKRNQVLNLHPEILFPTDFVELIQPSAKKFDLDPELILSIIRQESAFNPLAKSPAEAYGLMQMLPSVAKEYQKKAEVPYKEAVDLFTPEINIPLGTSFLSDLYYQRWKKKLIPAVASYNASQRAVQNWINMRYDGDILAFIEEVPYEETRGYIKLVLRNYVLYKRRLSKKSFLFPEQFLELQEKK